MSSPRTCSAFVNNARLATGPVQDVVADLRAQGVDLRTALVFDDASGDVVRLNTAKDLDLALAADRPSVSAPTVTETLEIRVLGRHRAWLEAQPGGPSAAIRRLVDAARHDPACRGRQARDAAYKFISMLAGDFAGYEEACRALFAGDRARFDAASRVWPGDVRDHGRRLAQAAFG